MRYNVYGSFLQSKMYQAGVTCSDCHNVHSLELNQSGDSVCLQCHESNYAEPEHHQHRSGEVMCVDCHMPVKNFMVVDARRDHSFRIPRPDLSESLGVPNTCNYCHSKETEQWAADQLNRWFPEPYLGHQNFADIIAAGRDTKPSAKVPLQGLVTDHTQPAIVRATAASLLASYLDESTLQTLSRAVKDPDPMVRIAASQSLQSWPPAIRWPLLKPLLMDSVRLVRVIAGEVLADIPQQSLPPQGARTLQK